MNEGFDPQHPTDDASDPLLHALRQHLGEGFGQAPPPAAWAGIRRRLPPAPPLPWWRRPRRLLPLLLLLVSAVAIWQAGYWHRAGMLAGRSAASASRGGRLAPPAATPAASSAATRPAAPGHAAPTATIAAAAPAGAVSASSSAAARRLAAGPAAEGTAATRRATVPATSRLLSIGDCFMPATRRATVPATPVAGTGHAPQKGGASGFAATTRLATRQLLTHSARRAGKRAMPATRGGEAAGAGKGRGQLATGQQRFGAGRRRASGPATAAKAPAATTTASTGRSQLALAVAGGVPAGQRPRGRQGRVARPLASATAPEPSVAVALAQPTSDRTATAATPTQQPAAADSLGGRAAVLARQVLALPMPLAAGLAPQTPLLPRSRRWAVQVLAGPTLSYRSLGAGAATPSALATAAPTYTSSATVADTSRARLERPALGWGAQVQLRRVLAGRWALAVGAGYHEYATRLALDVTTYRLDSATNRLTATTTAVRQRDTYRVLTVPVQLSYLLGPRGPLQLGVLAGAEPTLYLGGRSTEASSCSCQQQVFTSAAGSPYRSLSLALSLGLDARYRLGGPASGWQLLAQPTARYVATPFVRSSALGYLGRQPYSLGLLLGVAWEW